VHGAERPLTAARRVSRGSGALADHPPRRHTGPEVNA
jgi:hypothetical protein